MILILIIALTEKSMGEENFIFSPYSIRKAFSVAMLASKGKTRKELQNAFTRPLNMFLGQKNSSDPISMDIALFLYMKDCVYN